MHRTCKHSNARHGFTLLEIMVVVVIVGLLASMAISSFLHSRQQSIAMRVANDLRIHGDAFTHFVLETGTWPADTNPAEIPAGMADYLPGSWTQRTAAGGHFDWDGNVFGVVAAVSVDNPTVEHEVLVRVDEILDDGNVTTGRVRTRSGGLMLILEE